MDVEVRPAIDPTMLEEEDSEDMWGDLEVQENIIPQLLEGTSIAADPSARKVRFTAASTLAVYPSEKSLSGEEGSDDEYEEGDDDEDDEDEDDGNSSGSEEAFSDDEIVINDFKDSLDLPFIHTSTTTTDSIGSQPTATSQSDNLDNTTHTPTTNPSIPPSTISVPPELTAQFNNKEGLHVQVEPPQQDLPAGSPSQRRWYQQKQAYQRYTPRYSPKSSPTEGPVSSGSEFISPTQPPPQHATISQEKPLLVQQLERAKLELNQGRVLISIILTH
jgi:hypothetical protein